MNEASRYLSRPAIRLSNGRILVGERGDSHADLISQLDHHMERVEHGFITNKGRYLSRSEARQFLVQQTGRDVGVGSPDSADLKKKPKTKAAKKAKLHKVFSEGKRGQLHSGSKTGKKVAHGSKQEIAIALSEAGMSRKKKRRKSVADALSK